MTRVAITGERGRVGSALVEALRRAGRDVVAWSRPEYDLDDPGAAQRLVARDRPELVFHAAGWTDVDGCAREPALAMRRNGVATYELARACAQRGAHLLYISTNEVFSGDRTDERGYLEGDTPEPPNAYGTSKLSGEDLIADAFHGSDSRAWIVRTSWIFGPPGNDFPVRITAAADRLEAGARLPVVADEMGRPTYAPDLAQALIRLVEVGPPGTYHLASQDVTSRYEWARAILDRCRPKVELQRIQLADYTRASTPPRWGVLDTSAAAELGVAIGSWREPLDEYLGRLCP
jgi:dTDP-4-dehydrorhamnose reductase